MIQTQTTERITMPRLPLKYYRFRTFRLWEFVVDMLLQPLMVGAGSKDAHWWDWEPYLPDEEVLKQVSLLTLGHGDAKRRFPTVPVFGIVNPAQIRSLYLTLFGLPETHVIQPAAYDGAWSLISYKVHEEGQPRAYKISRFLVTGTDKNLCDG
ncbi:MAG: hypothetical protein AAFR22_23170, partial [Chloroflexota bacterium]